MSWAGLKKAASRAGTQVSMKLGQVERTDDSAFKVEEERFKVLDKQANTLQKEAKAYLDAVRSVSASSTRIGNTLDLFFGTDSGEQAISANAYKRAVEELEGDIARTIVRARLFPSPGPATPATDICEPHVCVLQDAPYRATVLEPIGKFAAHLPEVNNAISKRQKKVRPSQGHGLLSAAPASLSTGGTRTDERRVWRLAHSSSTTMPPVPRLVSSPRRTTPSSCELYVRGILHILLSSPIMFREKQGR